SAQAAGKIVLLVECNNGCQIPIRSRQYCGLPHGSVVRRSSCRYSQATQNVLVLTSRSCAHFPSWEPATGTAEANSIVTGDLEKRDSAPCKIGGGKALRTVCGERLERRYPEQERH